LNSKPTDNVTIAIATSDATEGTVSTAAVTFTPLNWNTPQTVTVTGVQDYSNDGNIGYTITTGPVTSNDLNYAALDPSDVNLTNNEVANLAPVNSVPGAQSVNEDTNLVFSVGNSNLISISDADAGSNAVQVTLTATNGVLTLSGITGLSFSTGDGTADGTMTFTGTVSAINTALAGMSFTAPANYSGAASVQIITNDQGNSGTGGAQSDTDTVNITVNAVNDAPTNSVPGAQSVNEDANLVFSSGNGNLISIGDIDAASGSMQVTRWYDGTELLHRRRRRRRNHDLQRHAVRDQHRARGDELHRDGEL
jgi:hypothetical protein